MRKLALLLTVVTGFSGLVYQVAWQKYLAVLLGSHSEATAAVLGIFLGGLSYGYLLFGRLSHRLAAAAPADRARARVVLAYGIVEASIGVWALLFTSLFALAQQLSLAVPIGSEKLAFAIDVGITALLIGPPTILMGGTIPLLTQGLARGLDEATRFHSWVYAFNTTGAFAGALCGAFVLIPSLGLRGTVVAMGFVNLAAGLGFVAMGRRRDAGSAPGAPQLANERADARPPASSALALAALVSGFAMMTLQTTLNRIGALSLGASQFTFAMVVATFVLCIAIGSFAVSALPRIPRWLLPISQWAGVAYGLCLYPFVQDAPYWAHRLRITFGSTESDFLAFHLGVLAASFLLLAVPLAISGALLPLVFHELRRAGDNLGGVSGRLYGANTVGSLLGALVGGYTLFFWLDLHQIYRVALIALAATAMLVSFVQLRGGAFRIAPAAAFAAVAAVVLSMPAWSPIKLSAGLFRSRKAFEYSYTGPDELFALKQRDLGHDFVRFYRDDPIASIAVHEVAPGSRSIVTNGKSDGNIPRDDRTQGLLALLPALAADGGRSAFVIGFGTGMSVGELAALDSFEEVVVAEISPGVLQAGAFFEELNRRPLASPKTRVVRSDAYRALLRSEGTFDVIVSEPSNPWVTGVEMLFSREFLSAVRSRLAPGGVFAQWFQFYEADDETVDLVLRTYLDVFGRVAIWHGEAPDLILLGFADPDAGVDLARVQARFERPDFRRQIADLGIGSLPRLLAHELLPAGVLTRDSIPGPLHTLDRPLLSQSAARAFFRGGEGHLPLAAAAPGADESLWRQYRHTFATGVPPDEDRLELLRETCRDSQHRCSTLFAEWLHEDPTSPALGDSLARARQSGTLAEALDDELLHVLAALFEPGEAASRVTPPETWQRYFHHAAPFAPQARRDEPGEVTAHPASGWKDVTRNDSR